MAGKRSIRKTKKSDRKRGLYISKGQTSRGATVNTRRRPKKRKNPAGGYQVVIGGQKIAASSLKAAKTMARAAGGYVTGPRKSSPSGRAVVFDGRPISKRNPLPIGKATKVTLVRRKNGSVDVYAR